MTSSELTSGRPEADPAPDVLSFGPTTPGRRSRRTLLVALLVAAVLVAGFGVWRALPRPAADFTLADLQGVYTGMVRSDGTNDVSTITAATLHERPATISPEACRPLFEATLSNQFPVGALDGVSTYWLNQGSATISLVTYRFPDPATARGQFDQVRTALDACLPDRLTVNRSARVALVRQDVAAPGPVTGYLSYLVSSAPSTARFTTDVAQLGNTVTWQYRYDYRNAASYTPDAAQQLMASLVSQMTSVQQSHR